MIDYEDPDQIVGLVRATLEEMAPRQAAADAVLASIFDDAYRQNAVDFADVSDIQWPENVHYEYIQHVGAHLGYRLPRASVRSNRGRGQRAVADGIERGLNRLVGQKSWALPINRLLDDMLIGYACAYIQHGSNDIMAAGAGRGRKRKLPPGRTVVREGQVLADKSPMEEVDESMPSIVRLDRRDVFFDTLADSVEAGMFTGHRFAIDRSRLATIAKANRDLGYDPDVIENLEKVTLDPEGGTSVDGPQGVYGFRDLVAVHEVWFPDWRLDKKADEFEEKHQVKTHGTLITVAASGTEGVVVRKPRPYYGPRQGGYVIGGMIEHPRYVVPTSPCVMAHAAARELNAVSLACIAAARGYKRLVLVDPGAADLPNKIKQSPHDYIVEVAGLMREGRPAVVPIEVGGLTPQLIEIRAQQMERYERVSGLSEVRRGRAKGGSTATEELLADQGAEKRLVRIERPWDRFLTEVFRRAAFFLFDSSDVVFSFGEEESAKVAKTLGLDQPGTMPKETRAALMADEDAPAWKPGEDLYFRGGRKGNEGDFEDLEIGVDVASQRKPDDPAQAAAVSGFVAELVQVIPAMAQVPEGVEWDVIVDAMAESKGVPELARAVDVSKITGNPALAAMVTDLAPSVGAGRTTPAIQVGRPAPRREQQTDRAKPQGAGAVAQPAAPATVN